MKSYLYSSFTLPILLPFGKEHDIKSSFIVAFWYQNVVFYWSHFKSHCYILMSGWVSWLYLDIRSNIVVGNRFAVMSSLVSQSLGKQLSIRLNPLKIFSFVCANRINLCQSPISYILLIIGKGLLNLPNLLLMIKQTSLSMSRYLALMTFRELLIVFLTKINLLLLLYFMFIRWFCLNLIKEKRLIFSSGQCIRLSRSQTFNMQQVEFGCAQNLSPNWHFWMYFCSSGNTVLQRHCSWLYSKGGFEEQRVWIFIYLCWPFEYLVEAILIFQFL